MWNETNGYVLADVQLFYDYLQTRTEERVGGNAERYKVYEQQCQVEGEYADMGKALCTAVVHLRVIQQWSAWKV